MDNIKGVVIKKLKRHEDDRGWLREIQRLDEDDIKPAMSYISYTKYNIVRGPHEHVKQTDFFVFGISGDFELYLWDNRVGSETKGNKIKLVVGETNPCTVLVPPGVVHAYRSITEEGSLCLNLPDKLYAGEGRKEKVDEIRHEENEASEFKIE